MLANRRIAVWKIQGIALEFSTFPLGQNQGHSIQTHCLSNTGRDGAKNIPQFEIGNHVVVQVQDEFQLCSFLLQLSTDQLGLVEAKAIIDGHGSVVAEEGEQRCLLLRESIPAPATDT